MTAFLKYALYLLVLVPGTLAALQTPEGPVARFTFNNQSIDDEITKHSPRLVGVNHTDDRFGNANSAIYLFGNENSYISLGTHSYLKPRAGSISLWIKLENEVYAGKGAKVNPILLTKCSTADDFYEAYAIYYFPETKRLGSACIYDSLHQFGIYSMQRFARLKWHHLAITYDDDQFSFYIDGQLEKRIAKNYIARFNPQDSVVIGSTANKKNKRFTNGIVDDIEFYDRVLTDAEIEELYHAPNPVKTSLFVSAGVIALLIFLFIVVIYSAVKYYIKSTLAREKKHLELVNKRLETELRVNRALMNPHFVFNSLNTLQSLILTNENRRAYHYLVKFSKLIRKTMEGNISDTISLEMELDILNRYMELENMRFEENISYSICVNPSIVPSSVRIPIMMIQPFVENAIWHGLLKKTGEKKIRIIFESLPGPYLLCSIEDNGIGRKPKPSIQHEKKSLATAFVMQRINLMNRIHNLKCTMTIEDKPEQQGTIVKLILPIINNANELTRYNY